MKHATRFFKGLLLVLLLMTGLAAALEEDAEVLELGGTFRGVHDPAMIEENGKYYLFSTGSGIPIRCSEDMRTWRACGIVFFGRPSWARDYVPNVTDIWAPDISYFNDKFHLYYSLSTFGSNTSAIGLATNKTLDIDSPDYGWVDEGVVITSGAGDNWNAIDPNLVIDEDGEVWLAFGSHWDGIKMVRLDYETGKPSDADDTLYALASRPVRPRAVEAPFIIHEGSYYYLFVSFDSCCRGVESTYNIRVGRAAEITGPYLDREGVPMLEGGGTLVLESMGRWRGPGHNAIFRGEGDFLVYHSYDAEFRGSMTLRIERLLWDDEGWPVASSAVLYGND